MVLSFRCPKSKSDVLRGILIASCVALFTGCIAVADTIVDARYTDPTDRYAHGVLGDAIEYAGLEIELANGRTERFVLEQNVFEDLEPRLKDLNGDGHPEVITVEASPEEGARLSIWGLRNGQVQLLAATPYIGRPFRWLAPIGAADLDGDGAIEIAYIDRPHLAKTLRIWRYQETGGTIRLTQIASLDGLTNHRIGEDFITSGIRECGEEPELLMADGAWQRIVAISWSGSGWDQKSLGPFTGPASMNRALACQ